MNPEFTHIWWWRKFPRDTWDPKEQSPRKGQPCRILCRGTGRIRNIAVEFEDGYVVSAPRFAVRKRPTEERKITDPLQSSKLGKDDQTLSPQQLPLF